MTSTYIEHQASLRIGTVEFIAPNKIEVCLDIESPESIALNTGFPRNFPRINSLIMIPIDLGFVVGQVTCITIQRSQLLKNSDFNLVNLPFPLKKMELQPIGTLWFTDNGYKFKRGIESFPSVGDAAILPTEEQLRSIIESGDNRRVYIGDSPIMGNAKVKIDPDRLFGRHLAILGNTGSGKSCSVAGIIRWSLESAKASSINKKKIVNSRFIVLDPNGEYSRAFADSGANIYTINKNTNNKEKQLEVPLWFWNTNEWCAFTKASPKTHKTTIVHALKSAKSGCVFNSINKELELANYVRTVINTLKLYKSKGTPWANFPGPKNVTNSLIKWNKSITINDSYSVELKEAINVFKSTLKQLETQRQHDPHNPSYTLQEINNLLNLLSDIFYKAGGKDEDFLPINEDSPLPFTGESFIRLIEAKAAMLNTTDYITTLIPRIKTLLSDIRVKKVIDNKDIELTDWLNNYIGSNKKETLTIIDLSLLPSDVTNIITAVIARMIFEAQQRYLKINKQCLPTILVMEEAHYFIKRYNDTNDYIDPSIQCCKIFEKIAREGRKFGLGLVLSSQRPSELSPTVLSQCNSFLLHRISNDKDQELVYRLLPDGLRGILSELPLLASQYAFLLGWVTELPIMVKMRTLIKEHCPQSDDPDFWEVWTGAHERKINWSSISKDWQGKIQN